MEDTALTLDSEHSRVISREEKLEYISTRLEDRELHAFMNLANEVDFCDLSKERLADFFDIIQHVLKILYNLDLQIKWTHCPIKEAEKNPLNY